MAAALTALSPQHQASQYLISAFRDRFGASNADSVPHAASSSPPTTPPGFSLFGFPSPPMSASSSRTISRRTSADVVSGAHAPPLVHRSLPADYNPTSLPTIGQPLLHRGKVLIYPVDWRGCTKCNDSGYKLHDPSRPHTQCWDKYGYPYSGLSSYMTSLSGGFQRQAPLQNRKPVYGRAPAISSRTGTSPPLASMNIGAPHQLALGSSAEGELPPPAYHEVVESTAEASTTVAAPTSTAPPPPIASASTPPSISAPSRNRLVPMTDDIVLPLDQLQVLEPGRRTWDPVWVAASHGPQLRTDGVVVCLPGSAVIGGKLCYKCNGKGLKGSTFFRDQSCWVCKGIGRLHR